MRLLSTVAAIAAAFTATAVNAESLKEYGKSGEWGIYTNPLFGDGCLMRGTFSRGTEVRVGVDSRAPIGDRQGYIAMFNDAWDTLPDGTPLDVVLFIDGTPYETETAKLTDHGRKGAAYFSSDAEVFQKFAAGQKMTVTANGEGVTAIDLTGTANAIEATVACQRVQDAEFTGDQFVAQGTAGGWGIFYNTATGGCFMEQAQGPFVVQLGTEAAMLGEGEGESFGFLAVYSSEARNIQDGEVRPVLIDLDGETFYGEGKGVVRDGYQGGYVVSNDAEFGDMLASKQTMTINPEGGAPVAIDLTGTMKAMEATRACQAAN